MNHAGTFGFYEVMFMMFASLALTFTALAYLPWRVLDGCFWLGQLAFELSRSAESASGRRAGAESASARSVTARTITGTSHALAGFLSTEEIEAIVDVQHGVAVDGIILSIGSLACAERT